MIFTYRVAERGHIIAPAWSRCGQRRRLCGFTFGVSRRRVLVAVPALFVRG